jgi:hypothetical protein
MAGRQMPCGLSWVAHLQIASNHSTAQHTMALDDCAWNISQGLTKSLYHTARFIRNSKVRNFILSIVTTLTAAERSMLVLPFVCWSQEGVWSSLCDARCIWPDS